MVQRVGGVGEGARSDAAGLQDGLGEEGRGAFGFVVVVEEVDSNRVSTSGTTANSDAGGVAAEDGDVLLHELKQQLLVKKAEVEETKALNDGRWEEAERVDLDAMSSCKPALARGNVPCS